MTDWHRNNGSPPRTADKQLRVRWSGGTDSKWTYTAKQLDWRITDKILAITEWKEEN